MRELKSVDLEQIGGGGPGDLAYDLGYGLGEALYSAHEFLTGAYSFVSNFDSWVQFQAWDNGIIDP